MHLMLNLSIQKAWVYISCQLLYNELGSTSYMCPNKQFSQVMSITTKAMNITMVNINHSWNSIFLFALNLTVILNTAYDINLLIITAKTATLVSAAIFR